MNPVNDPDVVYLADHSVLLAIPAFVPAFLVAGLVIYLAVRDRKAEAAENADKAKNGVSEKDEEN
ncbi:MULTISPECIES: hypothetical protein [Rhodococcus]|uniref:Uncharacterized protein n=1 Tax=Rhodococcus jostii TaxID=132919 RepID=A0A1H5G6N8_RHOJO|nr:MULTISPECIES: hypothetical protein [Rhodococcus]MBC2639987.1 hypothetical protein [Rhodococcus sp. 3A]MBC2895266.1 hypothetical protein [Rhodococcus sp. 4CII]SEE10728.1 hypothetical protein SAMN04490220_6661 [Rhodococcus jostii]